MNISLNSITALHYTIEPRAQMPSTFYIESDTSMNFTRCDFTTYSSSPDELTEFRTRVGWDNTRQIKLYETDTHIFELHKKNKQPRFFIFNKMNKTCTYASVWRTEGRSFYFQILLRGA